MPLAVGGRSLAAHTYLFSSGSRPLHVFYLRYGDDAGANRLSEETGQLSPRNRIHAALERRRNRGQQVVEVVMASRKDAGEATADFVDFAQRTFGLVKTGGD